MTSHDNAGISSTAAADAATQTAAQRALTQAVRWSRYARQQLRRDETDADAKPTWLTPADVAQPFDAAAMRTFLAQQTLADEPALWDALRRLRKQVYLRVIARDLGGLADLQEVVTTLSALADVTLTCAVEFLERRMAAQYGMPRDADGMAQQLHVIGMGKLGGRELNASSDIDLIFLYPEEGETEGDGDGRNKISNHEFFIRLARKLIAAFNETTAAGFVFRVDMRLRPWGNDGPLACGFDMLEQYLIAHGREWERYAWIKARVVRGDQTPALDAIVQPFVYRRHLDYSAFESLRALHREVRNEVERRDIIDNVKLGPGGIREVEFIAQVFQLIRGGNDKALRAPATLSILPQLIQRHLMPAAAVRELETAYVFLRNLEHRLQYLDDRQTQTLPRSAEDRALIAQAMGYRNEAQLLTQLNRHRARVTRHFETLFADAPEQEHALAALWNAGGVAANAEGIASDAGIVSNANDISSDADIATVRALGFQEPQRVLQQIAVLRESNRTREMPAQSVERLRQVVPRAVEAAAQQSHPDATFERLLHLLESIGRRDAYLALLLQYPQTIAHVAQIANASPWAASYLARHPILLDELLDERVLYATPDWPALQQQLRAQLDEHANDAERQLDVLRHFKHGLSMRLLAQDLDGALTVEKLSDHLSALADVILAETLRVAWQSLKQRHREMPAFAIIGYGKLGSKELGYASDLDIIFLYDDAAPEAAENYARLAQRLNYWLTSLTPAGILYETDLRLRPDGASGLLVSSLAGFAEYQKKSAWTWEHQALTRARFAAGDAAIGARFEQLRLEILQQPRMLPALRADIVKMRETILETHPDKEEYFDLKHSRGGLVDVEFIVQYLVLGYAHQHPALTANAGNLALLEQAAQLHLIPARDAQTARAAYRTLRKLQHAARLQGEKHARVPRPQIAAKAAGVMRLWEKTLAAE